MSNDVKKLFERKALVENTVKIVPFYDFWTGNDKISDKKLSSIRTKKLRLARKEMKK